MTLQPFRIDNISPIITYQPVSNDPKLGWASVAGSQGQAFHYTSAGSASFAFSFFGDSIQLFGQVKAPLPATCIYNASVIGSRWAAQDTRAGVLANFTGLPTRNHDVNMTVSCNHTTDVNWLQFDYAMVTAAVGNAGELPMNQTLDDMNPRLSYTGSWAPSGGLTAPGYFNQSQHFTNTINATVSLSFNGGAVAAYGVASKDHGLYTASLDGQSTTYNSSSAFDVVPVLLFFQAGLDPTKEHTLSLTNKGPAGLYLGIDSFIVFNATTPAVPARKTPIVAIIAPVATASLALLLLFLFFVIRISRRRRTFVKSTNIIDLGDTQPLSRGSTIIPALLRPEPFNFPTGTYIPGQTPTHSHSALDPSKDGESAAASSTAIAPGVTGREKRSSGLNPQLLSPTVMNHSSSSHEAIPPGGDGPNPVSPQSMPMHEGGSPPAASPLQGMDVDQLAMNIAQLVREHAAAPRPRSSSVPRPRQRPSDLDSLPPDYSEVPQR